MQSQLNKLKKIKQQIIAKAEKRDATALSRSDQWQDSIKGFTYETNTATLANVVETLEEAIKDLENFIEHA